MFAYILLILASENCCYFPCKSTCYLLVKIT